MTRLPSATLLSDEVATAAHQEIDDVIARGVVKRVPVEIAAGTVAQLIIRDEALRLSLADSSTARLRGGRAG